MPHCPSRRPESHGSSEPNDLAGHHIRQTGPQAGGLRWCHRPIVGDPLLKMHVSTWINGETVQDMEENKQKAAPKGHKKKIIISYGPSVPSKSASQPALTHTQVYRGSPHTDVLLYTLLYFLPNYLFWFQRPLTFCLCAFQCLHVCCA